MAVEIVPFSVNGVFLLIRPGNNGGISSFIARYPRDAGEKGKIRINETYHFPFIISTFGAVSCRLLFVASKPFHKLGLFGRSSATTTV